MAGPNNFDVNVNLTETGADALGQAAERTLGKIKQSVDMLDKSFSNYNQKLESLLAQLNKMGRADAPAGQTIRDLQMVSGGTDAAGRVRQALAGNEISQANQLTEVLNAKIANAYKMILDGVAKSIQSAAISEYAKTIQTDLSRNPEVARAQIAAQRARAGFAGLAPDGANRTGSITSPNPLGISNLRTLEQERAALAGLLQQQEQITNELAKQAAEERTFAGLNRQISQLNDDRIVQTKDFINSLKLQQSIRMEELNLSNRVTMNDEKGVLASQQKLANMRMQQMTLQGIGTETKEYQDQLGILTQVAARRAQISQEAKEQLATDQAQARLQRSRDFASGTGDQSEIAKNSLLGARRTALSSEGQASLLALQTGLSVNYALIGGIQGAVTTAIGSVVEFDEKMRLLQAIAGATETQFNSLSGSIQNMAKSTRFSAVELVEGATILAQAGLSVKQIEEVLPKVADFAVAVGTDMKTANDLVTTTMNVFSMDASQVSNILNTFTTALNTSKLSIEQLSQAFQYSANIAADAGVRYEDLTAVIAGMAQAGIKSGSMIGTGLRQVFAELANPTEKLTTLANELGISMDQLDIKTQGVVGVLQNMRDAGLTTSQAMDVFEKRTASALIAAVNQSDYMQVLRTQTILNTAAEDAASKSKESLSATTQMMRNSFLSFINDAAKPFVTIFTQIFGVLNQFGAAAQVVAGAGTVLMVVFGAAALASIGRLIGSFFEFSQIMVGLPAKLGSAQMALKLTSIAMAESTTVSEAAAVGARGLGAAFLALEINPVILGLTALIGVFMAFNAVQDMGTNKLKDLENQIDLTKTSISDTQTQMQTYDTVIQQIDERIANLTNRHEQLTHGQDNTRNATLDLKNETLSAAYTFGQYNASIDATGESLNSLISKLIVAREKVQELQAAEAKENLAKLQTLQMQENAASGQAAQNMVNQAAAPGLMGTPSTLSRLRMMGMSGGDVKVLARGLGILQQQAGSPNANDPALAASLMRMLAPYINKGGIAGVAGGDEIRKLNSTIAEFNKHVLGSLGATNQIGAAQDLVNVSTAAANPRVRAAIRQAEGGGVTGAVGYATAATDLKRAFQDLAAQYNKGGMSDAIYNKAFAELAARGDKLYTQGEQSVEHLKSISDSSTGIKGATQATAGEITKVRQANQEVGAVMRTVTEKGNKVTEQVATSIATLARNGDITKAKEYAARIGLNLTGSAQDMEKQAMDRAIAARNHTLYNEKRYMPATDPSAPLVAGAQEDAANSKIDSRYARAAAAAGKSAAKTALQQAQDALNSYMTAASGEISAATKRISIALNPLKDIRQGTDEDSIDKIVKTAADGFTEAQAKIKSEYEKQIAAQQDFLNKEGGMLSDDQRQAIEAKMESLKDQEKATLDKNVTTFFDAVGKSFDKIPEIAHPIKVLMDALAVRFKELENDLNAASQNLNETTQEKQIFTDITDRMARAGTFSTALQAAVQNKYDQAMDEAAAKLLPRQISIWQQQLEAIKSKMSQAIRGANGLTGNDIANMTDGGTALLESQQSKLGDMQTEAGANPNEAQAKAIETQKNLVADLGTQIQTVNTYRQTALQLETEITAAQNAQRAAAQLASGDWKSATSTILEGYAQMHGMNNTFSKDMLDSIPGALDATTTAFHGFFDSLLKGTASVKSAFQNLAVGILDAMMQVVESELAKQMVKLLIQVGAAMLSGGGQVAPADLPIPYSAGGFIHRAGGGDVPSMAALRGMVRATKGIGISGRDSVPILAKPGEYVLRNSAVDAIGKDNLDMINHRGNTMLNMTSPQRVAMPAPVLQQHLPDIYIVSPDKAPSITKKDALIAVQDDMVNKGPIYKMAKAISQGQH